MKSKGMYRIRKQFVYFSSTIFLLIAIALLYGNKSIANKISFLINNQEVLFKDILVISRDGVELSGIVALPKHMDKPSPVILQSTIYVRDSGRDRKDLLETVKRGYVGVIVYARGKRYSKSEIWPYENDGKDTYDVIEWISKQEWCDGRVGMYGGSYNGFTQWAALKEPHPALKTIVPYVANRPGMGLPMENNIFINPNYEWAFYVGNNKYLDTVAENNRKRYRDLMFRWWDSGIAYNKIDSLDETPNKWFQRWLKHPSYDGYWQNMVPYKEEFAQIKIPVLSIDGYFNDSQNSGLYYLREHYKYNPNAEHYLIIGPYSHFGAQRKGASEINGYKVDNDALIDTREITYQWFDYIFKDSEKPSILKDRINYQVMDANEWRSANSIPEMSNKNLKLFLSHINNDSLYKLSQDKPTQIHFLNQNIDFADRNSSNNNYYPDPIIRSEIDFNNGYNFVSKPFEKSVIINGSFNGQLEVMINKKDFDFGVTLYELKPNGDLFHLSYIIQRASYSKDISKRHLLEPGKLETILFTNTHLVSKRLDQGSRLLIHLNVNKNPFLELNYGSGKNVSEESIEDAKEELIVKWSNHSYVEIPIWE